MKRSVVLLSVLAAASAAHAQYWSIGGNNWETPYSVNNAGQVAGYDSNEYFVWSAGGGISGIGGQIPGNGHGGTPAISANGQRIGGTSINQGTGKSEISMYDVGTGAWTQLGSLGSFSDAGASAGFGISADGSTVVGNAWIDAGNTHAVRWQNGVLADLGSVIDNRSTRANGVSGDGSVIGGWQDREDGYRSASVWINGAQTLLEVGGDPLGEAMAVSRDGNWVVGQGGWYGGNRAFMWSPGSGLSFINNPWESMGREMVATAVNGNGTLVVGYARAFWEMDFGWIWTPSTGVMELGSYASLRGVNTGGDFLTNPLGISHDGHWLVGQGINHDFTAFTAWAIQAPVPEPASLLALGAGAGLVLLRRRRSYIRPHRNKGTRQTIP